MNEMSSKPRLWLQLPHPWYTFSPPLSSLSLHTLHTLILAASGVFVDTHYVANNQRHKVLALHICTGSP